jgi:membrane associated rhomboid family serine protease
MSVLLQNTRRKMMLGQDGNALFILIIINVVLFVLLNFVKILYQVTNSNLAEFQQVLGWFSVPADANVFATRPWTLFTYMFSHIGFWSLLSNMLWLWGFGFILQDLAGNKKLIPVYLYGGFVGSIFFLLTVNAVPGLRATVGSMPPLMGAGPAVMAIAIATTMFSPQYRIFPMISGGIPLWVLTLVFVLITLGTNTNAGYAMAQLAAGITGFLFTWQMRKGNDWSDWMNNLVSWVDGLFNPEKKHQQKIEKQRLYYKAQKQPYKKTPHITQQRIDDLLDKIHHKGYSSLSDEEKEFLTKASSEEF